MSGPSTNAVPEELPRVFDGDIVVAGGSPWVIRGDELGKQSRSSLPVVPPTWPGALVYHVATSPALDVMPVIPAPVPLVPPTAERLLAQISSFIGETFPPVLSAPLLPEIEEGAKKLRDADKTALRHFRETIAEADPAIRAALADAWAKKKAADDKQVADGFRIGESVAAVIPGVGVFLVALLAIASLVASTAAQGPVPQATPTAELVDRYVYRGFTGFNWSNLHPLPAEFPDWQAAEDAIRDHKLAFMEIIDAAMTMYTAIFRVDFRRVFPMWWQENTMDFGALRAARQLASADRLRFKASYWMDPVGQPARYLFEALPDPAGEALKALAADRVKAG